MSTLNLRIACAAMTRLPTIGLALAIGLAAAPSAADARPATRPARVGFLGNVPPPIFEAFRQGLRDLGYREGQTLLIERRTAAEGGEDRLPDLPAELVRLKVDVIVAPGPVSLQAARGATSTIPIVTVSGVDAVAEGWAASFARPGGNTTGFTVGASADLTGKYLELLKEATPALRRVAVLLDLNHPKAELAVQLKVIDAAARSLDLQLQMLEVRGPDDLAGAFGAAASGRAGALIVWTTPMLHVHQRRIVDLAARHRLPAIAFFGAFAEMGGLMAYGPNLPALFRRAAVYVDRILKGANPAGMPVEQPARPELTLNLKTARTLGLTVPSTLILRADHVIQ